MTAVAYALRASMARLGDDEWDVRLAEAPPSRGLPRGPWKDGPLRGRALRPLGGLHALANSAYLPLISRSLFDALVGPEDDCATGVKVEFEGPSEGRYVFAYVPAYSPVFDAKQSEWRESSLFPGKVEAVSRLVLKKGPLPAVFRIREDPGVLYVSHDARERAEGLHVTEGVAWTAVDEA